MNPYLQISPASDGGFIVSGTKNLGVPTLPPGAIWRDPPPVALPNNMCPPILFAGSLEECLNYIRNEMSKPA